MENWETNPSASAPAPVLVAQPLSWCPCGEVGTGLALGRILALGQEQHQTFLLGREGRWGRSQSRAGRS